LTVDVDDEAGEPVRLHLPRRPVTVRAICRIEVRFREQRDVTPHPAAVANEQTQVVERGPTNRAAHHDARIESADFSFPQPRR